MTSRKKEMSTIKEKYKKINVDTKVFTFIFLYQIKIKKEENLKVYLFFKNI